MLRIGVDLIEVERVERVMNRYGDRFFERFFTPAERAQCKDLPVRLAARIAAKEAAAKALGTGIGDVRWIDIEVSSDDRGAPHLHLHAAAAELAQELGLCEWQISLSHTAEHAIAFVVAVGNGAASQE
ncbi:MAG TPA: holo-ACP synthase [Aggregatilinea sp.]|uniref:holo-ACP synthase n=1 Tax=Aggregatilinea sp. TaxID=2806333 RepID=UPI002CD73E11|nr:holo-ACP synthase [Aggregatilinea sp.]HML20034.1 holo-ACP synthase [Aggregatilinea sp.]